uniref:Uncharacterized protein n=1 Tax=Eutreptiella gymnastica TaxID=73025 RepID=A0A7S1IEF6_9EUGL|mmetsp:Transcript_150208/g.262433  ORF Transcript_150208/g.262433 Transcript_150208/m.262433 type:complete len:483 (+) Transcript_150208:62-1510(+)
MASTPEASELQTHKQYLKDQHVPMLFDHLLSGLLRKKPDDALAYVVKEATLLQKQREATQSSTLSALHNLKECRGKEECAVLVLQAFYRRYLKRLARSRRRKHDNDLENVVLMQSVGRRFLAKRAVLAKRQLNSTRSVTAPEMSPEEVQKAAEMSPEEVREYADSYKGKTNREVYAYAFHDLVMKPMPGGGDFTFFGNTQRAQFAEALRKIISTTPEGAQIWDVGAGAGDIVPLVKTIKDATLHLEEPNQHLLDEYKKAIENTPGLSVGKVYPGPLQDFYEAPDKVNDFVPPPCDLVLAIHMIYFLNDYTQEGLSPIEPLKAAMGCLYKNLKKGGKIFIVYAGPNNYAIPISTHYFDKYQPKEPYTKNLNAILDAWKDLFQGDALVPHLNALCPEDSAKVEAELVPCHFFAEKKLDLAAMGAITYLIPSNDEPFDTERMYSCCEWLLQDGHTFGLAEETGDVPQKGCWKISVDQAVVQITKQ